MRNIKYRIAGSILSFALALSTFGANPITANAAETIDTNIIQIEDTDNIVFVNESINTINMDAIIDDNLDTIDTTSIDDDADTAEDNTDVDDSESNDIIDSDDIETDDDTIGEDDADDDADDSSDDADDDATDIDDEKEDTVVIGPSKAELKQARINKWLKVCSTTLSNLKKKGFKYSNSGLKRSYSAAVKSRRRSNCAMYVSWCLQQYGVLSSGDVYWSTGSGKIQKRGFSSWSGKAQIIKVNKKCSSVNLQKGDIICWKGAAHTNVYAGKSSSGARLWYDGGKVATAKNRSGSTYKYTGARALGYLNKRKIGYIIRINF